MSIITYWLAHILDQIENYTLIFLLIHTSYFIPYLIYFPSTCLLHIIIVYCISMHLYYTPKGVIFFRINYCQLSPPKTKCLKFIWVRVHRMLCGGAPIIPPELLIRRLYFSFPYVAFHLSSYALTSKKCHENLLTLL